MGTELQLRKKADLTTQAHATFINEKRFTAPVTRTLWKCLIASHFTYFILKQRCVRLTWLDQRWCLIDFYIWTSSLTERLINVDNRLLHSKTLVCNATLLHSIHGDGMGSVRSYSNFNLCSTLKQRCLPACCVTLTKPIHLNVALHCDQRWSELDRLPTSAVLCA